MDRINNFLNKYIEELSSEDEPELFIVARERLSILHLVTGLYWDLKTPLGRRMTVTIILTQSLNCLFYGFTMTVTVVKSFNWHIDVSLQILNYILGGAISLILCITLLVCRREVSRQWKFIVRNPYEYDLEIEINKHRFKGFQKRSLWYVSKCYPMLALLSLVGFGAFRIPVNERYVNGIDLSLPIVMWYPFPVESWPVYILVALSQLLTILHIILVISFTLYIFFDTTTHLIMEQQRLNDSVNGIERRAKFKLFNSLEQSDLKEIKSEFDLYQNKDFLLCLISCLKENISHHKVIKASFKDVNKILKVPFAVSLVLYMCSMGGNAAAFILNGYLCSKVSAFFVFFFTIITAITMCHIGQESINVANELPEAIYNIKWYLTDKKVAQYILILLNATRHPMSIATLPINYKILCIIFRGTYSFYSFFMLTQGYLGQIRRRR